MNEYLYHGSITSNLNEIKVYNSTDSSNSVHASTDPFLAIIFAIPSFGQLDFDLRVLNNQYVLTERRKDFLEEYNKKGYLYCLDKKDFKQFNGTKYCSNKDAKILSCITIDNLKDKIIEYQKNNKLVIYKYPEKPSYIPSDDSDLKNIYYAYLKANFPYTKEHVEKYFPQLLVGNK